MDGKRGRGRPRKTNLDSIEEAKITTVENEIDNGNFNFDSIGEGGSNFNPLGETPISRDYATPKIEEGFTEELEEPTFHVKSFDEIKNEKPNQQSAPTSSSGQPMVQSNDPLMNPNPAMNELDDKDKLLASEQMVDAVLDTYDTVCTFGTTIGKVKEQEVQNAIDEGRINPQRRLTVDEQGNSVSVMEFVRGYNEQVTEAVKPDPAFRKKVKPPMVRIFAKRGWGMTDEQFVLFAFGKDISMKAITLFSMKKGMKDILSRLEEEASDSPPQKRSYDKAANPSTPPPPPPPPPSATSDAEQDFFETESISNEELAYFERMQQLMREREEINRAAEEARKQEGVEKMDINFDDNPLRENQRREYPEPKVEEHFIKGGEIKEEPLEMNNSSSSQSDENNQTDL
jgi:hypothetical protein